MEQERLVRYRDLRPCLNAFIDTRTPGSDKKENFTIIGPGVAEHPDQHVHIALPHGFNIGGARQPPHCVNSQHSHETAEVFVVHSGRWAFRWGERGEDGEAILEPGDTISIPIHVFRGFENIGDDEGFLFAVLGGDDPGHVTWAPYVFEMARDFGLILLENGQLVDTTLGETVPEGMKPTRPTTAEDVARCRRMTADEMAECVALATELSQASESLLAKSADPMDSVTEAPIIGQASEAERLPAGRMSWSHGFHVRRLDFTAGSALRRHRRHEEEVVFIEQGAVQISWDGGSLELQRGDVLSLPIGLARSWSCRDDAAASAIVVRGGDHPGAPDWV